MINPQVMKEDFVYLKPNVVIEPLIAGWYAWSHLISPATAAMNITGRHLKIIDSYIQAPEIHAQAIKNPKMLGGPFMDFGGKRVDEVKDLREKTLRQQKDLLDFSQAIRELNLLLKNKAKGYSLESLYPEIPELLRGYVELIYDLNNNPSFRLFESLLYKSKYYNPSQQSVSMWLTENDERPFVLSTPRLREDNVLDFQIPFNSEQIDDLCRMKRTSQSLEMIKQKWNIDTTQETLFESFFTPQGPPRYQRYQGENVRMRYFGHACILIETKELSVLIDPVVSYYGYQQDINRFSDVHLPDQIDYVLITHNHQDHILFETLLPLRHRIKNIVIPKTTGGALQDPSLKLMFQNIGFKNIIELGELETLSFHDCAITGVPFIGEHSDLNIQAKICYHLKVGEFSMLFVADSNNIEPRLYEHVRKITGEADVVFLGMECDGAPLTWLYGPLMFSQLERDKDSSRRLSGSNFEKGKALIDVFQPREVYVYAMGMEPWMKFISSIKYTDESNPIIQSNKLIDHYRNEGKIAERLFGEKEILYKKKNHSISQELFQVTSDSK